MVPTQQEQLILKQLAQEYIDTVNQLTEQAETEGSFPKLTTKDVDAQLPSAVCNQAIRDARSVYKKSKKLGKRPILRKRVYYVNNQNYTVYEDVVAFPILMDGKVKKTSFYAKLTERHHKMIASSKLGLLRVVERSSKWSVQISLKMQTPTEGDGNIMGVDLGLKVPAVAVTSTGKTRFFGNGRMNKFVRRKHQSQRRRLGKLKKLSSIRTLGNKQHRWIKDQNHKISRQLVNVAIQEGVTTIKLEQLQHIHKTARTSRKNAKNLHSWTFYQLAMFIAYKAKLAGIRVIFVEPAYTSQTCPVCGDRNKAQDRKYTCGCGYHAHRDRVAGMNIMKAPAKQETLAC